MMGDGVSASAAQVQVEVQFQVAGCVEGEGKKTQA
jgi:hypothetical protein